MIWDRPILPKLLLIAVVVVLTSCPNPSSSSGGGGPADTRTFYAVTADGTDEMYQVTADLYGISDTALVYVERGQDDAVAVAQSVANEFESRIYSTVRSYFATESDVDNNGKVIVLLLDIVDGYTPGGGYVAGYYDPNHVFAGTESNGADMIFIDTNPATPGTDTFFRTIAHEFQHLVNFAQTYLREGIGQQDTWINEGLSLSAEYLYAGSHSDTRINYYNYWYGITPIEDRNTNDTIARGNNFYIWDGPEGDVLADYSTAYIFFQWLRTNASNGAGIYSRILDSPYTDHRAVTSAAGQNISAYASTPTLDAMIRDWYTALYYKESSGLYGFGGDPTLNTLIGRTENVTGTTIGLLPLEGVFNDISTSFTPSGSGTNVSYRGLSGTSSDYDDDPAGGYSGDVLLAYNWLVSQTTSSQSANIDGATPGLVSFSEEFETSSSGLSASTIGGSSTGGTGRSEPFPLGARGSPFGGGLEVDGNGGR